MFDRMTRQLKQRDAALAHSEGPRTPEAAMREVTEALDHAARRIAWLHENQRLISTQTVEAVDRAGAAIENAQNTAALLALRLRADLSEPKRMKSCV